MNLFKKQDFQRYQAVLSIYILYGAQYKKQRTKNENLSVIWLDVVNVYGSVRHRLIEKATENFWFSEELKNMLIQYNNSICMRFSTDKFTTQWQRLEVVLPLDVLFQ